MWTNETGSGANHESLVQVNARGANVAVARPVRVQEMRPAISGMLATTVAGRITRAGIPGRDAGPERLVSCHRAGYPMLIAMALRALVLLNLVLSMIPCPVVAGRTVGHRVASHRPNW